MTPVFLGTKERATFFHPQQNTHSSDRYQSIKLFHRNCQTPKVLITTKCSIIGKEATKKDPPRWKGFFNRTPTEPKLELIIISWKNVKTRWDPILIQASNGFPPKHPPWMCRHKQRHEIRTSSQLMLDPLRLAARRIYPPHPGCGFFVIFRDDGKTHHFLRITRNPEGKPFIYRSQHPGWGVDPK